MKEVLKFILVWTITIVLASSEASTIAEKDPIRIQVFELFTKKIDHDIFNWTSNSISDRFHFRPSILGYPDLPSWIRYMYSAEHRAGFMYGTPPETMANRKVDIEIVALNRQTFETRVHTMSLEIVKKEAARNVVHMKIDNLDWVNLMDPGRIENLKNIFRTLWPESAANLNLIFLESAIKMGARLPASPQLKEGVIVHLGSNLPFSERLKELQEEIKPLYKMTSCTFKRTSVQTLFEEGGFKLDWCAFRIVSNGGGGHDGQRSESEADGADRGSGITAHGSELIGIGKNVVEQWVGLKSGDVPERNYIDELAYAVAIPGMILAILVGVLSAILCFQHDSMQDDYSDFFFENIFHICTDMKSDNRKIPTTVVHLSDSSSNQLKTTTTTTLKSLRNAPGTLPDDVSVNSNSHMLDQTPSHRNVSSSNSYLRPQPPPYYKSPAVSGRLADTDAM